MLRTLAALLILGALAPFAASAQSLGDTDPLTISISPAYPRPYDTVTVTVGSNSIDLTASTIRISVNGAVVEEGLRSTQVKLGGPGTKTTIAASATNTEGTFQDQVALAPGDLSVVVEPVSSSQPLYQGATLVPSEGQVRIVAVADLRTSPTTRVPNSQISYTWKLGTQVLQADSGLGRNVLVATAPARYRDADITVTATNQAKTVTAQAATSISPVDPLVRIYRSDPLEGIDFAHALSGTFALSGTEEMFRALPFYFKTAPTLAWTLNGNASGATPDLTVRSSGGSGTALLGVAATGPEARAEGSLTLRFGSTGTGIFGR